MRGSIVKKGDRYYIKYYVDKCQKWKAAGSNKKDAERMLTEIVHQIHGGKYYEPKPITLVEFADKWMSEYVEGNVKLSTQKFYWNMLDHIKPVFGNQALTDIHLEDLQGFISRKIKEGKLSSATINHLVTTLTALFKYAVRTGYLRESPAAYLRRPKKEIKEMDFLTKEEVHLFLEHTSGESYPPFLCAIMTGMRRGELLAMKWSNIDWNRGQYFVCESLSRWYDKPEDRFQEPKSIKSRRAINLAPTLMDVLKQHRAHQNTQKLQIGPKYQDQDLVFCKKAGTSLDPDNLTKLFQRILKKAGMRQMRLHCLRHTYVSLLIAQGESPKYIQHQLGHASITTTLDRYGHLMPEVHQEAASRLDDQLFGGFAKFTVEKQ